jgi:SAM-dependent methyltransferase
MAMTRRERAVRLLPLPMKSTAKAVRHAVDPIFVTAYRRRSGDQEPIPPSRVRARSGSPGVQHYIPGGIEAADELEAVLAKFDRKFSDFDAIYDFGCGAGRVLRRVAKKGKAGATFDGSDVDAPAIEWARANLPGITWKVSNYRPPLPYHPESFDLIYSISIFTHFNEGMQFEWLHELHRLMKPGAMALLTTHGEHAYGEASSGAFVSNSRSCAERVQGHGTLADERFIYEPYEITSWNEGDFPGIDDTFGITFHSDDYINEKWGEIFDVKGIVHRSVSDGWQDTVVVQKRSSE